MDQEKPQSQFAQTLGKLVTTRGLSLRAFELETKLDHTTISRLLKTQRPRPDQIAALCGMNDLDERAKYALVVAHLQDEAAAVGLDAEKLTIRYTPSGEWELKAIPQQLQHDLEILIPAARQTPALAALINDLATLVATQKGDGKGTLYPFPQYDRTANAVAEDTEKRR